MRGGITTVDGGGGCGRRGTSKEEHFLNLIFFIILIWLEIGIELVNNSKIWRKSFFTAK